MKRSSPLLALFAAACAGAPPPAASPNVAPPASANAPPPDADVQALQKAGLASRRGTDIVRSLTEEVGPRLAGSAGDRAAVGWAERTMRALGLAGVHSEPVTVPRWERGDESAALVGAPDQRLVVAALGGSPGTPAGGVEADVVEVESLAALESLSGDATRGKILFANVPTRRARDGAGYGDTVGTRYVGPKIAAKHGAVAVLIRSVGTDSNRLAHTGGTSREAGVPVAALSVPDADLLHGVLARQKHARVRLSLGAKVLGEAPSANVVGDVKGSERPDEIVLLGAHLDSWDLGTGAVDDGAGCAIVLEAARLLAAFGKKPKRTIRVVLFAAEEVNGAGSKAYAAAHASEAGKHVLAMEADSGTDRVYETRWLGSAEGAPVFDRIARSVAPLGIARSGEEAHGGADTSPLKTAGVPILDLRQDFSRYFDIHHTANDTFDKVDPEALAQVASAYASAAWLAANADGSLGRVPEDKRAEKW